MENINTYIANGNSLPITIIGDVSPSQINVFVSLGLTTNLVSTGQFVDNDHKVEFSKFGFVVQD